MLMAETIWVQKEVMLRQRGRGIHLITDELATALPEIATIERGLAHSCYYNLRRPRPE